MANMTSLFQAPLPSIRQATWETWTLFFYDHYASLLLAPPQGPTARPDSQVMKEVRPYLKECQGQQRQDFALQLTLKATPFFVGIFGQKRQIRFYSPRLGQELFLLEGLSSVGSRPESELEEFHHHVEKAASLSGDTFPSLHQLTTLRYQLPSLLPDTNSPPPYPVDASSRETALLAQMKRYRSSVFESFSNYGLNLMAQYSLLRIHLLKFIALLPSLDSGRQETEVKRLFQESLRRLLSDEKKAKKQGKRGMPCSVALVCRGVKPFLPFLPSWGVAWGIRTLVQEMAKRFIAGRSIEEAQRSLVELSQSGRDATLDQLGELVVSEKEADHYCSKVLQLIRGFALHIKKGERNGAGLYRAHVSIKVSALCSDFKPEAEDYTYNTVAPRLKQILLLAREEAVFINIDAEHYTYRDAVFNIYRRLLLETPQLKDYGGTGIVIQAYLRDAAHHFTQVLNLAKERGVTMPIRLVKGAYWDTETIEAEAYNFDAPQFLNKEETDLNFRQLAIETFRAYPHLQLCLASHNFSDHCYAVALRETYFPQLPAIEHQCLHRTYEALSIGMARLNWVVRNYVPVGKLLVGMSYLVRRIMENSSQVGVLTIMRSHKNQQAARPSSPEAVHGKKLAEGKLHRDPSISRPSASFFNVPPVRLYLHHGHKKWMDEALQNFHQGQEYPNDRVAAHGELLSIECPSDPSFNVGKIRLATVADAQAAVDASFQAYKRGDWAQSPWIERAATLIRAADLMLVRRLKLAALICYEGGKTPKESLADVDEAIDFLNFYAREEGRLKKENPKSHPRGVTTVISPWNFPLAIPCGMTVSSLVAGNTVLLKSAKQTPLIAQVLVDILHEAGVPRDILIHLPGPGSTVGECLVDHPRVASVVFTGSKAVGLEIARRASKRLVYNPLTQTEAPTRIITEMGGKNAIIVTANAELDETIAGILFSSFAHAGQKCSACSRILVDNKVKGPLIERLRQACSDIKVGPSFDFATTINPVISRHEKERLREEAAQAAREAQVNGGRVWLDRSREDLPGHCVGPVLIELPPQRALSHQSFSMRELFGPIIHVIGFESEDQALKIFNATDYALTGGLFAQSQDDIDTFSSKMECGNIYVNRNITGARVAIEPFGGFKLSGTGPKAGGPTYLTSLHLNDVVLPEKQDLIRVCPPDEKGSEASFDLCDPWVSTATSTAPSRWRKVAKGIDHLIGHFDDLYQGIYREKIQVLENFKECPNIQLKIQENHPIPGQLSYTDFGLMEKCVVILAYEERAYFSTLLQALSALALGLGVTVIARNQKAALWWRKILKAMAKEGIPKRHFNVFFAGPYQTQRVLKDPGLSCIVVDGHLDRVQWALSTIYGPQNSNFREKRMKVVLSPYDSPEITHFQAFLERFTQVRSFAVNTMRHGAPLHENETLK